MNDDNTAGQTAATASALHPEGRTAVTKRRKPKTVEEQLAEALSKAETLKHKVGAERDRLRLSLVEDLYVKHGVDPIDGDLAERERLAALRRKLGVDG